MTVTELATTDVALTELLDRASERGYVLASELEELRDPMTDGVTVEDAAALARDHGLEVVDDLAVEEGEGREAPAEDRLSMSADPVRQYLDMAARHELLTAEDEANLAKRYQAGLAAAETLADGEGLSPRRRAMLQAVRRDGERAKEDMIRSNLRLVVPQAKKWLGRDMDMIELLQEGNLGLIRAVEKFDHTKGYKFSTYAVWWIRQALQRGVSNKARTIRVPSHWWELSAKLRRVETDLRQQFGRDPSEQEIAAAAEVPVDRLREVREALREPSSLDTPVGEDGDATLGDLIADAGAEAPEQTVYEADARARIERALAVLDPRERTVVGLRFGFVDGESHTLDEIGQQFQLSRERIRQIEKEALAKLRHPAAQVDLGSLLEAA